MASLAGYVGRDRELSRLQDALSGGARLVLVVGDAGVGKTRFTGEGMARAAAAGMVMLRGECLPLAGSLPLLPVADALRQLRGLGGGALLATALDATPAYAREEVGRLLPEMGTGGGMVQDGRDEDWSRERLFAGLAELLAAVAGGATSGVGLVVEDVHWADSATLDCLTFLARASHRGGVRVVATCRGDEAPLAAHVAGWLADARGAAGVEEILLGPLSRAEVARQAAELVGGPLPPPVIDELYARAEGNPFFTEQLVAAALASGTDGSLQVPAGLPGRLAELLRARADRCAGEARAVLAGLAVAGRPLVDDQVAAVTGLARETVRRGLRELAAARLLAEPTADGANRPRHMLLAEAVAAGLLPGERAPLHERTARTLAATGDEALAAEVAGHWQAADHPAEELRARALAAKAAERVFGYAEAAAHTLRAIELSRERADVAAAAGIDVPRFYVRATDTLHLSGDRERAAVVAAEAYRYFAGHPDPAIAAVVCHRAAIYRTDVPPAARLEMMGEALRLFEQAPPSADHAQALLDHAITFLALVNRRPQDNIPTLNRAFGIAESAGAAALLPRILAEIAWVSFVRGQVAEGFATLERGWALARAAEDGPSLVWLAINHSDALLKLGHFDRAAELASRGFEAARQAGLEAWYAATMLPANASEALLAVGRTDEAAALIDPLTSGPPDPSTWLVHRARVEVDLLRGDTDAAAARWQLIAAMPAIIGRADVAYESAQHAAEVALWRGNPGDALAEARRALALFGVPDLTILCGRLLAAGMRACADLAERARARRDEAAVSGAAAAAAELAEWVEHMHGAPFTDHPFAATIPAERATWQAERTRFAGSSDPDAWADAARAWQDLGCRHRAAYAWWRQAQARLDNGEPAALAAAGLRAAAVAADGHAPLLAQVRALAGRARIPLQPTPAVQVRQPEQAPRPYDLTGRELAVLRLLAAGRTNAQIGAELYISPKTASVHVTSILRKLGVSGRVQAAAVAERAGLLRSGQPEGRQA